MTLTQFLSCLREFQPLITAGATLAAATVAARVAIVLGRGQIQIADAQREIAKRQKDIAEDKLRLELFDRRFALYQAFRRVAFFVKRGTPEHKKRIIGLIKTFEEGRFLFPAELTSYFDDLVRTAVKLHELDRRLADQNRGMLMNPDDELTPDEMNEIERLLKSLEDETDRGPELFEPFLSFGHIVRDQKPG